MEKYRNSIITFLTFLLTYIIQDVLTTKKLINTENIALDLFSWLVIFFVVYLAIKALLYLRINIMVVVVVVVVSVLLYVGIPTAKLISYNNALSYAQEKEVTEMLEIIDNNSEEYIFLYTSKDCKYCIDFVPTIKENLKTSKIPVYYVKRETDINGELKKYFQVETIPFLVRIENSVVAQNYFDYPIDFWK